MSDADQGITRAGGDPHAPPSVSPVWSKRIIGAFWGACILLVILDFVIDRHGEHPWEELPAFYPLYGFIGVAALIVVAKELRKVVARNEDYYDPDLSEADGPTDANGPTGDGGAHG